MGRGRIKESGLTEVEETVLEMVVVGQRLAMAGLGRPPTYRTMVDWMGWKLKNNLEGTIRRLERKGFLKRSKGRALAIEVLRVLDGGLIPGEASRAEDVLIPSGPVSS